MSIRLIHIMYIIIHHKNMKWKIFHQIIWVIKDYKEVFTLPSNPIKISNYKKKRNTKNIQMKKKFFSRTMLFKEVRKFIVINLLMKIQMFHQKKDFVVSRNYQQIRANIPMLKLQLMRRIWRFQPIILKLQNSTCGTFYH